MPLSRSKAQVSLRFVEGGRARAEGSGTFIILDCVIISASDGKCAAFVCKIAWNTEACTLRTRPRSSERLDR